jgi:DNA-directed RNA polymerase subunit RPC12/RpoP
MKLLAKSAADRPQSAHTVIKAIESIERELAQSSTLAPSPPEPPSRPQATPAPGMRAIAFKCSRCGRRLQLRAELVGKQIKCPGCGQLVHMAQPPASPSVAPEKLSMPDPFDPYHKWLGIRDAERPPNHYRLLGLELFENDLDVIDDAAQRQMAHVRNYQLGPNSKLSQRILNELAKARICLLDPDKKTEYDRQLRLATLPQAPAMPLDPVAPAPQSSSKSPMAQSPAVLGLTSAGGSNTRSQPPAAARADSSLTVVLRNLARKWPAIAAILLLAVALFFAPQVIRIVTNKGELVIKTDDPNVEVTVRGNGEAVIFDRTKERRINLKAGDYEIEVVEAPGGFHLFTKQFSLTRGGQQILDVRLELDTLVAGAESANLQTDTSPKTAKASKTPPQPPAVDRRATTVNGKWRIDGTELVQESSDSGVASIAFGDPTWTDYEFSAEIKRTGGAGYCLVLYRATDKDNWFDYAIRPETPTVHHLRININGLQDYRKRQVNPQVNIDEWHAVSVIVRGSQIRCYCDAKEIFRDDDPRHPRGKVALATLNAAFRFRKIAVNDLAGNVLFQGPPELPAPAEQ